MTHDMIIISNYLASSYQAKPVSHTFRRSEEIGAYCVSLCFPDCTNTMKMYVYNESVTKVSFLNDVCGIY